MAVLDLGALPMPRPPAEDVADIQGLLRTGYGTLDAVFLLLRVADAASARAWLATARVTTVADLVMNEPGVVDRVEKQAVGGVIRYENVYHSK